MDLSIPSRMPIAALRLAMAVSVASLGCLLTVSVPRVAASAACSTWGNFFDGGITTSPQYYVSANIMSRDAPLCGNGGQIGSAASAWVMLAGGSHGQYAQVGYLKLGGFDSIPQYFTEYNDGSSTPPGYNRSYYGAITPGQIHSYFVSYQPSTGHIALGIDGVTRSITPWGADTSWSPGWKAEVFGETWNLGDDVPGTASAPTNFGNILTKNCRSCGAATPTWSQKVSQSSAYKQSWINNGNFTIWTQR
jgi:hypothetical protein